jgi:hypothetical protein
MMMKSKNTISIDAILGWSGTAAIIIATCIRAAGVSNLFDLIFTDLGCFLWAIAAYRSKNNALLTVNAFSVLIVTAGIIRHFF